MPAFLILSVLTYRDHTTGLLLLPAIYVLGFTLIITLDVGELVKPLFNATLSPAAFWPALALSLLFLVLGVPHLSKLRLENPTRQSRIVTASPTIRESPSNRYCDPGFGKAAA